MTIAALAVADPSVVTTASETRKLVPLTIAATYKVAVASFLEDKGTHAISCEAVLEDNTLIRISSRQRLTLRFVKQALPYLQGILPEGNPKAGLFEAVKADDQDVFPVLVIEHKGAHVLFWLRPEEVGLIKRTGRPS